MSARYVGKNKSDRHALGTNEFGNSNISTRTLYSSWHTTSYSNGNDGNSDYGFESSIKSTSVKYVSLSKLDGTTV